LTKRNRTPVAAFLLVAFLAAALFSPVTAQDQKPVIESALQKGDTALAINLLNQEIELDKSYYLNYYTLGMISFERQKWQAAIEQFEMALSKKKKHYNSLYQLGLAYLKVGDLENAEKTMQEGIKKDKKEKHRFEDGLGQVMLARENWGEADRLFRQALVGDPQNANYHIHLGDANFYEGIPSLAITEYEKALEVDTAGLEVYFHWAEACLEMKDYTCAIEKLHIVLTKDSTHAPAWMRAGGIYFKAANSSRNRQERNDRYKDVIGSYKKYLELTGARPDSSNVRVFYEMAMSYNALFGYEDAAGYFEQVLAIPMQPRDIYFQFGKALWGMKEYVRSGQMLTTHIEWVAKQDESYESRVRGYELYQLLGDSYYYRRPTADYPTAIDYYKKSLADRPDQKRLLQNIAVGYHSMKSYAQALDYYQQRIDLGMDEKSASMYKNAGYCALNMANNSGEDDDEDIDEEEIDEVVENTPAADVNYFEVAVGYLQQYLEYKPDEIKVVQAVANTYLYQLADCINAIKFYERILEIEPENCDAKKSIGYAFFGELGGTCSKNYGRALTHLKAAYTCKGGGCKDPDLVMWIAQCYHLRAAAKAEKELDANDDFKNSFEWYGKVLKCDPSNSVAKKGQDQVRFEFVE